MNRHAWLGVIARIAAGIALSVLLAEGLLRAFGISYPIFHTWDEETGWAPIPGAEGLYRAEDGSAFVRINSAGFRDREHLISDPRRTLRIAVLGDSYTEALQVSLEKTYWSIAERELGSCDARHDKRVELLNFGVSGFGTAQELLALRRVWAYAPDIVILAFTTGNDIRNNSRELEADPNIPYFVLRDGKLVLDASFRQVAPHRTSSLTRLYYQILPRSNLLQLVHEARRRIIERSQRAEAAEEAGKAYQSGPPLPFGEPRDPRAKDAWDVTEALIQEIGREVQQHGALFLLMTGSNSIQDFPDPEWRQAFIKETSSEDLFYAEKRLMRLGERVGFPVLALAPHFQAFADSTRSHLHGSGAYQGTGHWNELGHELAGKDLAAFLCERALPRLR